MPEATPSEPSAAAPEAGPGPADPAAATASPTAATASPTAATASTDQHDAVARAEYLAGVMAEIDAEVRRRRASGDLPAGLERELDELFLEFSPVGLQGKARLRENLALVDGAAYVDISVPVESQRKVGVYVKRLIRKSLSWYIGFIVHQIVKFGWAVSRMLHLVVDHIEDLETTIEDLRVPELPATAVPVEPAGSAWWADDALEALAGTTGRVLHAECGDGSLVQRLVDAGVDAYGVDAAELVIEPAVDRGLDVRAESALDHLEVVAEEALSGLVLSGSLQWLHPNQRDRLVGLAAARLALDGVLVLHSSTPEAWRRGRSHLVADLAPGHPLHPETWTHLLAAHGLVTSGVRLGGDDRTLDRLDGSSPDAATVNAAIDVVNELLLGPGEYVLTAVRER
jgi:SAM-dependent methyltransferase